MPTDRGDGSGAARASGGMGGEPGSKSLTLR
jgi:hypothetical protein